VAACSAAASRRPDARDDGRRERHQLTRQAGEPVGLAHRIERLDQNGLAVDVAELLERSTERIEFCRFIARTRSHQHSDVRKPGRLLRNSSHRPCDCCTTHGGKELAPPHSITSSARLRRA